MGGVRKQKEHVKYENPEAGGGEVRFSTYEKSYKEVHNI